MNKGIESNLNKCETINDMRSLASINELHQLMRRMTTLSRLMSCVGDKAWCFFTTLIKGGSSHGLLSLKHIFKDWKASCLPLLF